MAKNRYISFDPNNLDTRVAFQVGMLASTYFPGSVGVLDWAGEPDGNDFSRVVDTPYYSDAWPPVVHVGDCEIIPVATYAISATANGSSFSDPLIVGTIAQPTPAFWADCVGQMEGGAWSGPNGVVNFDDVSAAVQYFISAPTAPHLTTVDIEPQEPDAVLNFSDIQQIVFAFQGGPYPFSSPADCTLTPRLDGYSNGGCQEPPGGRSRDGYPFCGDDVFQFNVDGHTLHAVHEHAAYNCCLADIQVTFSLVEDTIQLAEEETFDGDPCACLCCYDVEATVAGLPSGPYNVEYCWTDEEPPVERCHYANIVIP